MAQLLELEGENKQFALVLSPTELFLVYAIYGFMPTNELFQSYSQTQKMADRYRFVAFCEKNNVSNMSLEEMRQLVYNMYDAIGPRVDSSNKDANGL